MKLQSKADAQHRVDQIRSFQAELETLENEAILTLSEAERATLASYHAKLIGNLSSTFDIDASKQEKQLSLGMKIASFLGALAFGASVYYLFYQFWGRLPTSLQIMLLLTAPLVGLAATLYAAQKEKTGYFAKLLGLVSCACFVLNISMLGQIYNLTPSPNAFLIWAAFALLLAYATDARLLLAAGILFFAAFLSAKTGTWSGFYWLDFGEHPENFFPAACVLFFIPFIPHHRYSGFSVIYRVFALLLFFIPVLILSNWGNGSYLNMYPDTIEAIYQIIGFILSAGAIFLGIKMSWPEVVNTGNVFFVIFLYTKFYDWWWDWMPKYLFFLLIGLSAVLILLIFKRLRKATIKPGKGVAA